MKTRGQQVIDLSENIGRLNEITDGLLTEMENTLTRMAYLLLDIAASLRVIAEVPVEVQNEGDS